MEFESSPVSGGSARRASKTHLHALRASAKKKVPRGEANALHNQAIACCV